MALQCNVGGNERASRIGFGIGLIAAGLSVPGSKWLRYSTGSIGAVSLITGLVKYCPVSQLVGRNTCHFNATEEMSKDEALANLRKQGDVAATVSDIEE